MSLRLLYNEATAAAAAAAVVSYAAHDLLQKEGFIFLFVNALLR